MTQWGFDMSSDILFLDDGCHTDSCTPCGEMLRPSFPGYRTSEMMVDLKVLPVDLSGDNYLGYEEDRWDYFFLKCIYQAI